MGKFVIHNSRIYFGKRPVKLVPSKNKQFPASKGYFTFTIKGWTYYILFAPTGIKVTARRGRKIVRTFVTRKIKKILRPVKLPKISFILRRFKNVPFKVMNFKFVIHNSILYFHYQGMDLLHSVCTYRNQSHRSTWQKDCTNFRDKKNQEDFETCQVAKNLVHPQKIQECSIQSHELQIRHP